MLNFLHNFSPNPVLAQLGPFTFRYYGIIIAIALLAAIFLSLRLAKNKKIPVDDVWDLAFWLVLMGIVGARLYEVVILEPRYFLANPAEIIKIWHGGLAIHGAILAGVLTLIIWCWKKKQSFWLWADIAAIVLPLAQAIGRCGNYFNQEVFGRPTESPWGIFISAENRPMRFINEKYFHPTFLYEAILNLILFGILFFLNKKQRLKTGQLFAGYLIGYGSIRFLMEFIRIDETLVIIGFRWPQLLSLFLIISGVIIFYKRKTPA